MTTFFTKRVLGGSFARATGLCLLALAAVLLRPAEAEAQWTTSGTNTTTTNNVGVGTTAPQTSVHVSTSTTSFVRGIISEQTSADSNSALFFFRKHRAGAAVQNGDNLGSLFATPFDGTSFINSARLRFAVDGAVAPGSVPTAIQFMTGAGADGTERMRITSAGFVGIGTAAPGSKLVVSANAANPLAHNPGNLYGPQDGTILHIVNADTQKTRVTIDSFGNSAGPSISFRAGRGTLAAPAATQAGDALGIVYGGGFGVSGFHTAAKPGMWMVASENWTDTAAGSDIFFNTVKNGTTATVERMRISSTGNVGIGTTTPGVVNGVSANAPYMPLHIQGQGANPASVVVNSASPYSGFVINDSSQPVDSRMWSISQAAGGGKLTFRAYSDSGTVASDKLVIDRSGNVGVGVTAPTAKLHVAGNITVDGNINAKYQDVAEWVPSTQKLTAGTVVILDTGRNNHVLASKGAYDTRVAGVISAQPGLSLGEAGEGKVLVATTGRVKVRVDATRAPIKIGDLIVTSEVEGLAMKSQPVELGGVAIHRPGTLIGKALESLEKGTGEILVLLSLQ